MLVPLSTLVLTLGLTFGLSGCSKPDAESKPSTDELLAKAPVFTLLLDASGNSPATNHDFLRLAWPNIEAKIRAMPLGSSIIVSTIGDSGLMPMKWRTRLQARTTKDGAPMDAIVRGVREITFSFPERIKGKEHERSHLIAGLFEASRDLNPASQKNVIVLVSDMIEVSPLANCLPPRPCKLPPPDFSLANTDIQIFGSAQRLQPKQAMTILRAWQEFFKKTGVDIRLHNTM